MVELYSMDVRSLQDPKEYPEVMEGLPQLRKDKILKYVHEKGRRLSLGASLLLRQAFEEHGKCMDSITFGENGKPVMEDFYFNLSHSGDVAVCAVSDRPVGCDIESIHEVKVGIAEQFFTKKEVQYLNQFDGEDKLKEFFRLWTMKESYMKMTGEGMKLALNQFEIRIDGEQIQIYREGKTLNCIIEEYYVPGYKLTVCSENISK